MRIAVIGAGYVGLATAACLATIGHHIFCTDKDVDKLDLLRHGALPFFEPHLAELVHQSCDDNCLEFVTAEEAIRCGTAIFICVGTPPLPNGDADVSALAAVARDITQYARGYRLVIEKSTVPVQTGRQLQRYLGIYNRNLLQFDVASNPEFLREGSAVNDFLHPDRIVLGTESAQALDLLNEIYRPIVRHTFDCPVHSVCPATGDVPVLAMDTSSAELVKHASNSFLAMKISFINMVADLCEAVGGDIGRVAEGIGLDPRIGPAFLHPGIGFGGFCFPKDLQAFVRIAEKFGCDFTLLKEAEKVNASRVVLFVRKLESELWTLRGKRIGVWGLAFKPNTDDVRFAPSLAIIRELLAAGAIIKAYDPHAAETAMKQIPALECCPDPYEASVGAEAILILTEWEEFRAIDWGRVLAVVERPLVVDGRNMFCAEELAAHGVQYLPMGRASAPRPTEVMAA